MNLPLLIDTTLTEGGGSTRLRDQSAVFGVNMSQYIPFRAHSFTAFFRDRGRPPARAHGHEPGCDLPDCTVRRELNYSSSSFTYWTMGNMARKHGVPGQNGSGPEVPCGLGRPCVLHLQMFMCIQCLLPGLNHVLYDALQAEWNSGIPRSLRPDRPWGRGRTRSSCTSWAPF